MYTTGSVRKFLNNTNALLHESNENVVDRCIEMILDKFANLDPNPDQEPNLDSDFVSKSYLDKFEVNKSELEQLAFSLKDEITKDHLSNSLQKKKKRNAKKRNPTEYNLFVKEQMNKLKEQNPDLVNKELMIQAARLWNEQKELKLKNGQKDEQNNEQKVV